MPDILKDLGIIITGFLFGAIPFCFILGKMAGGKRLTEIGDKNPGGWNLVFNVSKVWGFIGIILDMAKGYFVYYLAYRFSSAGSIEILGSTNQQFIAILAGCAAVVGHNYTPYLKFNGGKGLATWGGLVMAANPFSFFTAAAGLLAGILIARNMIWSVSLGIIFTGLFLWLLKGQAIFLVMTILLLVIMIPKQVNKNINLGLNFKFRKEATLGDLFKPKIR
jgi:glycerol-3-phosphate acyltransferase PlsY